MMRQGSKVGRAAVVAALVLVAAACHGGASGRSHPVRPTGTEMSEEELGQRRVTRVEELFVGRFPGVQVMSVPGQGFSVRIRGQTTIYGSNEPLYVVDGMPYEPGPNGLIEINPNDVAKIEVLKDAGQTAQYGVRGANGVILITTKRGK